MKSFLTSSLPLGGKVDKAKLWTNEGHNPFLIEIFHRKYSIKGQFHLRKAIRSTISLAFPLSSTLSPSKAFPPLLFLRCYIPAFVVPALPVRFNPRFSSYPLFSKTISPRNPFAPNRCFRRKHNYYLITFPKTPFIVPRFFILNANICSFFYSITYKTCQHIAIFRKFFHFFIDYFKIILRF